MSWSLLQSFQYTSAADYRNRVIHAFLKTADQVVNESPSESNHAARLALANQVISGTGLPPRAFEMLPVLNPGLQVDGGDPTDNDILFTVSQQWDYFANA